MYKCATSLCQRFCDSFIAGREVSREVLVITNRRLGKSDQRRRNMCCAYRRGVVRYLVGEIVKLVREVLLALHDQLHDDLDLSVEQCRQVGSTLSATDVEAGNDFIRERFPDDGWVSVGSATSARKGAREYL